MKRSPVGMISGIAAGMAVGAALGMMGSGRMKVDTRAIKRKAGKALRAVNGFVDNLEYMVK